MLLLVSQPPAHGASAPGQVVVVRTYDTYGISDQAARTAARVVNRLFEDAGIQTKWRRCRVVGRNNPRESDPCADVVKPNELIIRVLGGPVLEPDDTTMSLGDAFIDPVTQKGALATVYADRVAMMATALHLDFGTMVGRAITHELAHLLLGTHNHTAVGLMRATWLSATLTGSEEADWLFTPEQRITMRLALATRLAMR
jgi:hypothetical protein